MTFAEQVIYFKKSLVYTGQPLPPGIGVMNPFRENENVMPLVETFYNKYYNDNLQRHLILGINPGRFGAGLTGIPFTDPKRLVSECRIPYTGKITHEPSSVFVYEVINAFGGAEKFYGKFFINSPCPLGFVSIDEKGREKNYNYYESKELLHAVENFIVENLLKLSHFNIFRDVCFCFGAGKNFQFLESLNKEHQFFGKIVPLEHPRFIMQYKSRDKQTYIDKYLDAFRSVTV